MSACASRLKSLRALDRDSAFARCPGRTAGRPFCLGKAKLGASRMPPLCSPVQSLRMQGSGFSMFPTWPDAGVLHTQALPSQPAPAEAAELAALHTLAQAGPSEVRMVLDDSCLDAEGNWDLTFVLPAIAQDGATLV